MSEIMEINDIDYEIFSLPKKEVKILDKYTKKEVKILDKYMYFDKQLRLKIK
jgi:hypothetical protein